MRDWRHVLEQWVGRESSIAPLARQQVEYSAWAIYPPSCDQWPSHLPTCQALQDFYRLCDGGYFDWFGWCHLSQLGEQNGKWFQLLSDWDQRGDVLLPERHVVLAEDGGGCPIIWDAVTDQVRAFQWDGGDWEPPLASSVEAFLTDLFNPEGEKEQQDWWYQFLSWLDRYLK